MAVVINGAGAGAGIGIGIGIGLAMAQAFARKGMRLVLADIEPDAVDRAVTALKAHGAEAIGVKTNVAQWTDVNRLAEAAPSAAAGQSLEPTRKPRATWLQEAACVQRAAAHPPIVAVATAFDPKHWQPRRACRSAAPTARSTM